MNGFYRENNHLYDMQKRIMLQKEIFAYNQEIVQISECQVKDLTSEDAARAAGVKSFGIIVNETNVRTDPTDEPLYESGADTGALTQIQTSGKSILGQQKFCDDARQLSSMRVGEGVWILRRHDAFRINETPKIDTILKPFETEKINQNRSWLYVQSRNYAGWIHADSVGQCSFAQMRNYLTTKHFVTVTKPTDIYIENLHLKIHFSMGSRLLKSPTVCNQNEAEVCPVSVYAQSEDVVCPVSVYDQSKEVLCPMSVYAQNESVICPVSVHGQLEYVKLFKSKCELKYQSKYQSKYESKSLQGLTVYDGYLPMTPANILCQAQKLLETPYRWGNADGGLDCSGMVVAVYDCFGLTFPRDSSRMIYCPRYVVDLKGMNNEAKRRRILQASPGSLIFFPGHVMMYSGMCQGRPYILHALSRYRRRDGSECPMRKCVMTPLELIRPDGTGYIENFTHLMDIS